MTEFRNIDCIVRPGMAEMQFKFDLTVKEVERQVASYIYEAWPVRDAARLAASNKMNMPPITMSFYQYTILMSKVPTVDELYSTYMRNLVRDGFYVGTGKKYSKLDPELIKERVHRAYPSMVRDLHFMLLLNESGLPSWMSMEEDINGVDMFVSYNNQVFPLAVFMNTKRGQENRERKRGKREIQNLIEIGFDANASVRVAGSIYLLGEEEVKEVKTLIKGQSMLAARFS